MLQLGRNAMREYARYSPTKVLMVPGLSYGASAAKRRPSRRRRAVLPCEWKVRRSSPETTLWRRRSRRPCGGRTSSRSHNCWTLCHAHTSTGRNWSSTPRQLAPRRASAGLSAGRERRTELNLPSLSSCTTCVELHLKAGRAPFDVSSVYLGTGKRFVKRRI